MKLDSAILYTNDIEAITNYYLDKIGLKLDYRQGDKYVSFMFDNGVRLGIKKMSEPRETPGSQTVFIAVDDAQSVYELVKQKQLNIYKELVDQPWGIEFSVLDPDGNKIHFLQRK